MLWIGTAALLTASLAATSTAAQDPTPSLRILWPLQGAVVSTASTEFTLSLSSPATIVVTLDHDESSRSSGVTMEEVFTGSLRDLSEGGHSLTVDATGSGSGSGSVGIGSDGSLVGIPSPSQSVSQSVTFHATDERAYSDSYYKCIGTHSEESSKGCDYVCDRVFHYNHLEIGEYLLSYLGPYYASRFTPSGFACASKLSVVKAVSLAVGGGWEDAAFFSETAVSLDASNADAKLKLGLVYKELGRLDEGLKLIFEGVQLSLLESYRRSGGKVYKLPRPPGRRTVVIYCDNYGDNWWSEWGPNSLNSKGGVGGSEEAVILLSRELSRVGYWVEVYGIPPDIDTGMDMYGVMWYHHSSYSASPESAPDVFIAWRYSVSVAVGLHAKQRYLWLQDVISNMEREFHEGFMNHVDGIFVVSNFHASLLPEKCQSKVIVSPNGINPEHFKDGYNDPARFIYASSPSRGLRQVLLAWPAIHANIPGSILSVYYGFIPSFTKYAKDLMGEDGYNKWYTEMEGLLKAEGVEYIGMVDNHELAEAYARSGFALYPTHFSETGCIALTKAQAMGAVPVTSKLPTSSLPELCGLWDRGPDPVTSAFQAEHDLEWLARWAQAVVDASLGDLRRRMAGDTEDVRSSMKAWTREKYSWGTVALQWHNLFMGGGGGGGATAATAD